METRDAAGSVARVVAEEEDVGYEEHEGEVDGHEGEEGGGIEGGHFGTGVGQGACTSEAL